MQEQRLPIVDSDDGIWGDILRQYLMKEHVNDDTDNAANGGHKTITIAAGTASANTAPIKFTTGTLLTSEEAGAMEYAGNYYYLTANDGTRKKIAAYNDASGATGDLYYRDGSGFFTRLGIGDSDDVLTVSGGVPTWQPASSGSSLPVADTTAIVMNAGDNTKQLKFDLSGLTASTTRTLTVPDANMTLVGTSTSQVLTGKTINGPDNTLTNISADSLVDGSTNHVFTADDDTKLSGIETGADVTDATNVDAAGAVMNSDTSTASMSFVVDEDNMASNSASKVPTQQSTKAYVDTAISGLTKSSVGLGNVDNTSDSTKNAAAVALTNKDLTSGTNTFPTFNQNTTGSAATLTNSRTFQTNLASTSTASFNGSANVTPGVTGTLPVGNGGTGATTLTGILKGNGTSAFTAVTAPSGTIVGTNDTQTLSNKRIQPRVGSTASSATPTINTDNYDTYQITALATNITSMTTNLSGTPSIGQQLIVSIKDNGSTRTIAWGSSYVNSGVAELPTATVAGKLHWVGLIWDGTKWACLAADAIGY